MGSDIEWTDETWNPLIGCRRVSPGCLHCYAERQAIRMSGPGGKYEGIVRSTPNGPRWTGASRLVTAELEKPLHWRKPRRIFVDSMADLFFEGHSTQDIAAVFGLMLLCGHHTFQVLTKRPERMRAFMSLATAEGCLEALLHRHDVGFMPSAFSKHVAAEMRKKGLEPDADHWPPPWIWLGTSVEDQATADERIPLLLETPAAVRFVSYEPALGPVEFQRERGWLAMYSDAHHFLRGPGYTRLDWIIAGSESGPGARPAELDWFRAARDQCAAAGVSFFFKQWVGHEIGTMVERGRDSGDDRDLRGKRAKLSLPVLDGHRHAEFPR